MREEIKTLGQRIKTYRTSAGLSQLDLELEIDASPGSLSRIESGNTNPTKETLIKISQVLKLPPDKVTLLFGIGEEPPTENEVQNILTEIGSFMHNPERFGYLTDNWWTFWDASDTLKAVFEPEGVDFSLIRGKNLMELLLNPKLPIKRLLQQKSIENVLKNQVCFFKQQIGERAKTAWGKQVLAKFFVYDEFRRYWDEAKTISTSFYRDRDREVVFELKSGKIHFLCSPRIIQSDSRFELVEFEMKK